MTGPGIGRIVVSDQHVDRLIYTMQAFAGLLVCVSAVAMFGWIPVLGENKYNFDVASEVNAWTWMNVAYMLFAAQMFGLGAWIRRQNQSPALVWALVAIALALLSLDDMISLHERFGALGRTLGGGQGVLHFAWLVPGFIAMAIILAIFFIALRSAARIVRMEILIGVLLFFGGAVGFEMISGAVLSKYGHQDTYTLLYHIEEMMEAIGMTFILSAGLKDIIRNTETQGTEAPSARPHRPA